MNSDLIIAVVGGSNTGKSTYLHRLLTGEFKQHDSSVGMVLTHHRVQITNQERAVVGDDITNKVVPPDTWVDIEFHDYPSGQVPVDLQAYDAIWVFRRPHTPRVRIGYPTLVNPVFIYTFSDRYRVYPDIPHGLSNYGPIITVSSKNGDNIDTPLLATLRQYYGPTVNIN